MLVQDTLHEILCPNKQYMLGSDDSIFVKIFFSFLENKPKKRSAFEYKYQISLENSSQNESRPVNRYLSMPKLRAAGKFLSDLISYLSGKNIIAVSKICPEMVSGVAA